MKHERFWKLILVVALALQLVRSEADWASFNAFARASVELEFSQTTYMLTVGAHLKRIREFMSQVYGEPHKTHAQEPKGCPDGKECG